VQSVEVGAALLRALADADGARSLGALARAAGMSTTKAHRYLVGYVAAGLVVQSERSGAYDLGPLAVRLGLAALERFDVVRVAGERLEALRDEVGQTVMISVWTDAGPTVARIELARHPVTMAVRVGLAYPILTSATGMVFLAYAPALVGDARIDEELGYSHEAHVAGAPADRAAVERLAAEVRARGGAAVDQLFLVGVSAVAAPLLDGKGNLVAVVTAIGRPGALDLSASGTPARALAAFARSVATGAAAD
jgi:DNA-binding IclR family transcriptional regulator